MTRIGEAIRAERQACRMTLAALSAQAGISRSYTNNIERGHQLPPPRTLLQISNVFPDVDSTAWLWLMLADSWGAEIAKTMRRWAVKQEQIAPSAGMEGE